MRGQASYKIYLSDRLVAEFIGDNDLKLGNAKSEFLDGHSASRVTFENVEVKEGETLKIVGTPNGIEAAPLDYVSFLPEGVVD